MSSFLKKALPIAIGIAAPGVGSALGASALTSGIAGGALSGLASGGGFKGALLGGLSGGLGSGLGSAIGGTAGTAAGNYGVGGALGDTLSGLERAATAPAGGLASAFRTGISNLASPEGLSDAISSYQAYSTQDEMKRKLLAAQNQAKDALAPYLSGGTSGINALRAGFDPSQITSDPGYQFRLQQGQNALEKSLAARGLGQSGAALKAAQEYGQGTAAQAYNDAFSQWLAKNSGLANYGQNATGTLTNIYGDIGDIGANADLAKSNILASALSNVMSGSSGKKIIGYDETGKPIYAE